MKKDTKTNIVQGFVIIASIVLIVANIYMVWDMSTTKASAQLRCDINHIDYVKLKGNGTCAFSAVAGDVSMCALPRDIHCEGLVQDFPLIKGLMKLRER
jgi:hypothetical protein